jgi:hypothetical protein
MEVCVGVSTGSRGRHAWGIRFIRYFQTIMRTYYCTVAKTHVEATSGKEASLKNGAAGWAVFLM